MAVNVGLGKMNVKQFLNTGLLGVQRKLKENGYDEFVHVSFCYEGRGFCYGICKDARNDYASYTFTSMGHGWLHEGMCHEAAQKRYKEILETASRMADKDGYVLTRSA